MPVNCYTSTVSGLLVDGTLPLFQCGLGSLMPMQVVDEVPAGAAVEEDRTS